MRKLMIIVATFEVWWLLILAMGSMHKPEWLSQPADVLLQPWEQPAPARPLRRGHCRQRLRRCGRGGETLGLQRSTVKQLTVCVLERGQEHVPGTFPDNFSELPGHVRFSRFDDPVAGGVQAGLFDLRLGKDVSALVANGLGGGSLINAGVAEPADPRVFEEGWPKEIQCDWLGEQPPFEEYYEEAQQMLHATARAW